MNRFSALLLAIVFFASTAFAQAAGPAQKEAAPNIPDLAQLDRMIARLAPAEIKVDTSKLSPGDQKALPKLIEAARILNEIFLRQMWSGNLAEQSKLKADTSPQGRARSRYFWMNKGPWSEMDGNVAFVPDVPAHKLPGANFYPEDMTKEEFEAWVKTLNDNEKEQAIGFFTVIRREKGTRKLVMFPYSVEYHNELARAAKLLHDAAADTENPTLKKFLNSRADAFLSNDYYDSDIAWMDLDAPLDITIGPYETYNDAIFGYKAAFEAYVNLRDEAETKKLAFLSNHLQEIENNLPEDAQYRNPKLGALSPIRVVDEVFASGDGDHGIKTAAYNLPNDDRVVAKKGSKRVMLKNIQEVKFQVTLVPISKRVLAPAAQGDVDFDAFFTHILAHELTHGLGPHEITVKGKVTNPRLELKELYSAIEEAKADVTGLFALQYLLDHAQQLGINQGFLGGGAASEHKLYTTFLASAFRTLRFGLQDAHARGMAMQINYLMDKGGYTAQPDGTFAVDYSKIKQAVAALDHDLLTVEATGDYAGAKKMLDMGSMRPPVQKALDNLKDIPVDIDPQFTTANRLAASVKSTGKTVAAKKKAK